MELIAQHVSPDGLLNLSLQQDGEDTVIGFHPFAWSTSSQFLASKWGLSREAALAHFLGELFANRAIIAVAQVGPAVRDVWITDRPASELKYKRHEESILFRFWDGTIWDGHDAAPESAS